MPEPKAAWSRGIGMGEGSQEYSGSALDAASDFAL